MQGNVAPLERFAAIRARLPEKMPRRKGACHAFF